MQPSDREHCGERSGRGVLGSAIADHRSVCRLAIWKLLMRGSLSNAGVIRYCIGCHAHNDRSREVSSHRAALKKTFIAAEYQAHNFRDMARMLHNFFVAACSHIEGAVSRRYGLVSAGVAVRTLSSDLPSVSSDFVHRYPSVYPNHGLLQDSKNTEDQINATMCAASKQKVIPRDTIPKAQETYKDSYDLGFCFSSVLYSSRSYDDGRRICPWRIGHEQFHVSFSGRIDFILFETRHESHYFVRHKQRLSPLELSSNFLPLTNLKRTFC